MVNTTNTTSIVDQDTIVIMETALHESLPCQLRTIDFTQAVQAMQAINRRDRVNSKQRRIRRRYLKKNFPFTVKVGNYVWRAFQFQVYPGDPGHDVIDFITNRTQGNVYRDFDHMQLRFDNEQDAMMFAMQFAETK